MRYVVFFIFFIGITLLFQNCSRVSFFQSDSPSLSKNVLPPSSNNGEGYGGKLSGEYYRFRPDFNCEGKESAVAKIQALDDIVTITESHQLDCSSDQKVLLARDVDQSIFQKDIIGYKEGIFEGYQATPESIPANLVEVWCRDRKDEQGVETITYFDRFKSEAVAKVYYATQNTANYSIQRRGDFPVSRVVTKDQVIINNGSDFELTVYRNQPSSEIGQIQATLKTVVNGINETRATNCRLSGSLDPSLWPAKQIVDLKVLSLKISGDLNTLAFTAAIPEGGSSRLFVTSPQGGNHVPVTPTTLGNGVKGFEFSPQNNSLVFWADVFVPMIHQLFRVNFDGSQLTQLNDTLIAPTQSVSKDIKFSADGKNVLYLDGDQGAFTQTEDAEMWLKSVPLSGGKPELVNPLTGEAEIEVKDFSVSRLNQMTAFVFGFAVDRFLYLTDENGKSPKKFSSSLLPPNWGIAGTRLILNPDPGHYFVVRYSDRIKSQEFADFAIKSSHLPAVKFPTGWSFISFSPNGQLALLRRHETYPNQSTSYKSKIVTLSTMATYDFEAVSEPKFSLDSKTMLALKQNAQGESRVIQISVPNHIASDACPQASGTVLHFKEKPKGNGVLMVVKSKVNIVELWERSESLDCVKRNSLPIDSHSIEQTELSPDGQSLLVKTQRQIAGNPHQGLFLVPLNGHPPYQIDSALHQKVKVSQVLFLKDSTGIVFVANSIRIDRENVFLWKIPKF